MKKSTKTIIIFFFVLLHGCASKTDNTRNSSPVDILHFINKVNKITHQESFSRINPTDSTTIEEIIKSLLSEKCNNTQTNTTGNFSISYNWITKSITSLENIAVGTIVLDFIAYRCPFSFVDRRFQRIYIQLIDDKIFINDEFLSVDNLESTLYELFINNNYSEQLVVSIKCPADKELQQIICLFDKILLSYFKFIDSDMRKSFNKSVFEINNNEIELVKTNTPLLLSLDTI
jgi:hypothetical protein